jgi:hypothetical protein
MNKKKKKTRNPESHPSPLLLRFRSFLLRFRPFFDHFRFKNPIFDRKTTFGPLKTPPKPSKSARDTDDPARLRSELARFRAQNAVLKRAVVQEQHRVAGLRGSLREKEMVLRCVRQWLGWLGKTIYGSGV